MNPEFRNYKTQITAPAEDNTGPLFRSIKGWGREDWMLNNPNLCMKILTVEFKKSCSLHYHMKKEEIFFIVKGSIVFDWIDVNTGELHTITLFAGDSVYIPVGMPHRFLGADEGGSIFVGCSNHHGASDSYKVKPGDSQ